MTIYTFTEITRRTPPTDPEHTLGVEVTDATIAALCRLGNIDSQHGFGQCSYDGAAVAEMFAGTPFATATEYAEIDAACTVAAAVYLPPPGTVLATSRADVDSIAAMAVLVLRALAVVGDLWSAGAFADSGIRARLAAIARADNFRLSPGTGRPALPTVENPWPETECHPARITEGALGVICSPSRALGQVELPMPWRVFAMTCWLLWGDSADVVWEDAPVAWWGDAPVAMAIWRACGCRPLNQGDGMTDPAHGARLCARDMLQAAERSATQARITLARALASGEMTVSGDGDIAIVRGVYPGAIGVGYSQADVVVAEQVDPRGDTARLGLDQAARKLTIAWKPDRVRLDGAALVAALNEHEIAGLRQRRQIEYDHPVGPAMVSDAIRAEFRAAAAEGRKPKMPTWGGNLTSGIVGSPQGEGSAMPLDEIIAIVRSATLPAAPTPPR